MSDIAIIENLKNIPDNAILYCLNCKIIDIAIRWKEENSKKNFGECPRVKCRSKAFKVFSVEE